MVPRRFLFVLLAAALTAHGVARAQATPSPFDLETARALFKAGRELRAQGDLPGAIKKLQAAHAAGRTPITGIELARTYAMTGRLVEAREVALDVGRIAIAADETERSAEARREALALAEELRDRIPALTIQVLHAPEDARVSLDGEQLSPALVGQPMRVNPTSHVVVVRAASGVEARESVTLAEREARSVTITFPGAAPAGAPPVALAPSEDAPGLVFGAAFALVPQIYLPARSSPDGTHAQGEVTAGLALEAGGSLTSSFDVLLRGLVTIGQRGSPASDLLAVGPGGSFRVARRLWLGGTIYGGRAEMNLDAHRYGTDWVFLATADIGYAVIEWPSGQWLLSVEPGYYFAGDKDNPLLLLPLMFGFRSF
jgi:hypothetical protein